MLMIRMTEQPGNTHVARSFAEANALLRHMAGKQLQSQALTMKIEVMNCCHDLLLEDEIELRRLLSSNEPNLHASLLRNLADRLKTAALSERTSVTALMRQLTLLN